MTFVDYLRYHCFTHYTKLFYCLLQFDASLSLCYIQGWFFFFFGGAIQCVMDLIILGVSSIGFFMLKNLEKINTELTLQTLKQHILSCSSLVRQWNLQLWLISLVLFFLPKEFEALPKKKKKVSLKLLLVPWISYFHILEGRILETEEPF